MRYAKAMLGVGLALSAGQAAGGEAGLDWLAGRWCGGDAGRQLEEVWLPEAGGTLLGMSRTLREGRLASFEFMRITLDPAAGIALHVQPGGVAETVFARADGGEGWIRFENTAHDFPNLIEYRREGERLRAYIAGPGDGGEQVRIPFDYARCEG